MANPNPQLEAALAQFAAQPGTTPDQEAQLRTAVTQDAQLLRKLNQDAANGQLMGLIRGMPLILGIATTACAHSSSRTPITPPKEPAAMNAPATGAYRPHTLEEFPELTPEEIGRRFLKLIDSLKTSEDLTLDHVQEVMRLQLTPTPETHGGFFTIHLPESGWYYGLSFYDVPGLDNKHAAYQFTNRPAGQESNDHADMSPVCGMDFYAYVAELKQMGFVEREDLAQYDSPVPQEIYDPKSGKVVGYQERRFFRLPGYTFTRGNVGVLIRERREAFASDAKPESFCVESISVGGGK